jgi:CRP-like cAMP-binding protein
MKKNKQDCDKSCFMCRLCLPEWKAAINANRKVVHFKKGQQVFTEGEPVEGMFFVLSGTVKVHKQWGDDKELILRIAAKGDIVGHRGIGADTIYPASGTALEAVSVCYIDLAFFTATLKVNHEFLYQLMMFFAAELKVSERKMRNLAHMSVKGRLAQAMLSLKEKFGLDEQGALNITLSRQDLASYIGTTYETVFRTINEMTEENILKTDGKSISIVNAARLTELVSEF